MSESVERSSRIYVTILVDEAYATAVDVDDIERAVAETLRCSGTHTANVVVTITDDDTVRGLNLEFRGVNAPTDVLSFPAIDRASEEQSAFVLPSDIDSNEQAYLGDIIIAYPYSQRQAQQFDNSIDSELRLLAVHGTLHLLGYDHDTPQAKTAMWKIQGNIMCKFGDHGLSDRIYND